MSTARVLWRGLAPALIPVAVLLAVLAGIRIDATPTAIGEPAAQAGVAPLAVDEHAPYTAAEARRALAALVVADRHRGGYDRDLFGGDWSNVDGCTTREHVLAAEAVTGSFEPVTCDVIAGTWIDWYSTDAPTLTDPGRLDVDHLVPLAHAWQAGAWHWTPEQRVAFANDLANPATLTAVSATQNRAKSDAPPDAWQPPNHAARCIYAKDWIATKTAWVLTITAAETVALEQMLERCPD